MASLVTSASLRGGSITITVEDNYGNTESVNIGSGSNSYSLSNISNTASETRISGDISGAAELHSAAVTDFEQLPSDPSSLTATYDSGDDQNSLSWTDNSENLEEENEFRIYRGTTSGSLTQYDTVGTDTTTYVDPGIEDAQTYYYEVTAANTSGESGPSNEASVTTPLTPPTGITVSEGSADGEIDLSWTKADDTSDGEWQVFRDGAQIDTATNASTTSYTDSGLVDGTEYSYFVRRAANGQTEDTGAESATTALPAASWVSLTPQSQTQINLDWTKSDDNPDGAWEVYRSEDGSLGSLIASPSLGTTTYSDTGLIEGTTYHYTVRRITPDATADSSSETITTMPTSPSGLGTAWSDTVDLSWTDNSGNEDGVLVYRTTASSPSFPADYTEIADRPAGITTYTDTDQKTNTTYHYAVTAYAGSSESGPTTASITLKTATATATTVLPDVQTPTLGNGVEDEIQVDWTDVTDYGEYGIQYRETGASTWLDGPSIGEANASAEITGLEDGEEYEVRMRTETEHRTGAWTAPTSIVTKFPGATNPTINATRTAEVDLGWTDNSDNEDGFRLYRAEEFEYGWGPWLEVADVSPNTTTHTDATAVPNTTYKYKIEAYTEHSAATSEETESGTTSSLGVQQDTEKKQNWHVEVVHASGTVHEPSVIGDPKRNPQVNDLPRIEVPVPKNDKWQDSGFDDAEMRVWKDGERQPIEQLEHRRAQKDRYVLEGRGGVELLDRVTDSVELDEAHTVAENLLTNNVNYAINVDTPTSSAADGVTFQNATSEADFLSALNLQDTDPIGVTSAGVEVLQTNFVASHGNELYGGGVFEGDFLSGGFARSIGSISDTISYTFTPEYRIEEAIVHFRISVSENDSGDGVHHGFEVLVDGQRVDGYTSDAISPGEQWRETSTSVTLTPGDHTVTFEMRTTEDSDGNTVSDFGGDDVYIDVVSVADNRFSYTYDNTLHEPAGYLNGPEEKPDEVVFEFDEVSSGIGIETGYAETDITVPQLGLTPDGTNWTDATDTDNLTHTFGTLTATMTGRVALERLDDSTPRDQTPRLGYEAQTLGEFTLKGDLDDTPLVINRTFDNRLMDILRNIAEEKNFIWEVRYDGGFSIEWCQPGQRTSDEYSDVIDYEVDTQTEDKVEAAIIYGSSQRIRGESIIADTGSHVGLGQDRLIEGAEVVYDPSDGTQFTRDDDYVINYLDGSVKVLAGGSMNENTTYEIDYEYKTLGEWTDPTTGDPREDVFEFPSLVSDQTCEQIAYYIVQRAATPLWEASMIIPKQPVGWNIIDQIDPEQVPSEGSGGLQIREVVDQNEYVELRLASRRTSRELVDDLKSSVDSVARKV